VQPFPHAPFSIYALDVIKINYQAIFEKQMKKVYDYNAFVHLVGRKNAKLHQYYNNLKLAGHAQAIPAFFAPQFYPV
jgi:hypothetical protein